MTGGSHTQTGCGGWAPMLQVPQPLGKICWSKPHCKQELCWGGASQTEATMLSLPKGTHSQMAKAQLALGPEPPISTPYSGCEWVEHWPLRSPLP